MFFNWAYWDPYKPAPNGPAADTPLTVYAPNVWSGNDSETDAPSPCKFDGPQTYQGTGLFKVGETPADFGTFVQDFDWQSWDFDGWNFFERGYEVVVDWKAATVDEFSGELITPGRWNVRLKIIQAIVGYYLDGDSYGNTTWHQVAPGAEFIDRFVGGPGDGGITTVAVTETDYSPPDDYDCFSKALTRWTRDVPTLPLLQGGYTIDTLPDGYQWPEDAPTHYEGVPIGNSGPFFPVGIPQSVDYYYAPPYIDVSHTKK